jgi:predicted secreted protein
MRGKCFLLVLLLVFCFSCRSAPKQIVESRVTKDIGPGAVWSPDKSFREKVVEQCSSSAVKNFGECFTSVMRDSKAPEEAVAFAQRIGNTGYMRGFRETGLVDIAYVAYPFRANENNGCYLVNGAPPVIDVDDFEITRKIDLAKDSLYREIASGFPKVELWPGDRWSADCIVPGTTQDGKQRFLVAYRLLNGCHACELLGSARVAFDFDRNGTFLGTELLGVEPTVRVFSDPGKPVEVAAGGKFVLVLDSNRTTGYHWERSVSEDTAIVKFTGTEYREPETALIGAGGKEVLSFEAAEKGTTDISLKYVRPWEKDVPPAKTVTFRVTVK